jgi:translocation and assembly module TamA
LSWSVGLEAVATDERNRVIGGIPRPRQTYFVGALPLYAMLDQSDNLLDPKKGFRAGLRLSPETSRSQGVQSYYLRGQFDGSYYQPINDRIVAAGRVRFASIPGADLSRIAPSRRLYAGGAGSIRGFGYQAVGPKNDFLEPVGGRSLVELSAEARIGTKFFDGALSVVPFIDAAAVSIDPVPDFRFIKVGAGIGIRYNTGFGPLRFDVATPINPDEGDGPVAVYVSLGQAF